MRHLKQEKFPSIHETMRDVGESVELKDLQRAKQKLISIIMRGET